MKNKLVIIGLILILVIGIFSVFAMGTQSWYGHKDWKSAHKSFDKSAWLEKMGLADATEAQIIEAKKAHWDKADYMDKSHYMISIREKLGLADDASDEEVKAAMLEWKESFHKDSGFTCKS